MNKTILFAAFVYDNKLDAYIKNLNVVFDINKKQLFFFKKTEEDGKTIVTFKLTIQCGERLDMKKYLPNAMPVHKRGTAIYSINALNKLIEYESGLEIGNIDYKTHKIDWDKYQDSLILNNEDELSISKIKRIFI